MAKQRVAYIESDTDPLQVCSRCRMCELICAFTHHGVGNPNRSRITVVSLGRGVDIPITCLHCEDPPCLNICPTRALKRDDPGGPVTVDSDLCIGCSMCMNACPVGAILLDPREGTAIKCDLCGDDDPQCVKYCPAAVLKLVDSLQYTRFSMKRYAKKLLVAGEDLTGAPPEKG